jgi:hypothetical protein
MDWCSVYLTPQGLPKYIYLSPPLIFPTTYNGIRTKNRPVWITPGAAPIRWMGPIRNPNWRLVAITGINRVAKNEQSKLWQHWVHKTPSGTPRALPQVKKRVSDAQDTWRRKVDNIIHFISSRYVFSYQPFYFDFHSARIIFDVSFGFYLWNVNRTTTWHLQKMLKFAFKGVSTKNGEPTYWTIQFNWFIINYPSHP